MLEAEGLHVGYGDAPALWDVSLTVGRGELVAVVGPNGAGKTTLVNAIARLLPNGAPDPSFSGDGKLTFSFAADGGGAFDQIFGLVPQGDGKIVVVGRATSTAGSGRRVGVARLNEDGSFDTTFSSLAGRPGRQIFDWATGTGADSVGRAIALAADGRIILSGGAERASGDMDFFAARLHNDYIFADGFNWGGLGSWSAHAD